MSIGINMDCCDDEISVAEQIALMKENGFTRTFCMADRQDVEQTIATVQDAGIVFESLHAQLAYINDMWKEDDSGDAMLRNLCDNVEACRKFGIPTLVVHLSAGRPAPLINDTGIRRYDVLMECAKSKNVTIAYENSRCLANLAMALEKYEDAGFCWDVGHENCFTPGMDFMPYFGHKLAAVHIHDNEAVPDEDLHLIPFDGKNDMDKIARELAGVRYDKCIMLEVIKNSRYNRYPGIAPEVYYARAAEAARRLEKRRQEYLEMQAGEEKGCR